MYKKILALLIVVVLAFSSISVMAAEKPVVYKSTITVTQDGGRFQVGFVNLEFKKEFLKADMLPITFDVAISAVDGVPGIEITPSTADFFKQVHMRIDSFEGLLFDQTAGKNIQVEVKKQQIKVSHFSRYAFW